MGTDVVIETFKQKFNINADTSDMHFRKFNVEPYNSLERNHRFGEKICLLYHCDLTVFNVEIALKILSFDYETHAEVLKLEIIIRNEPLATEMASCKNFLQRKRNMNLAFEIITNFTKLFETRRLICQTVFQKQPNVATIIDDAGIIVKCWSEDFNTKYLELNWTITWNVDEYEVSDFIEFYCNYSVLRRDCGDNIKKKLKSLVEPNFDFHSKLKLWKLLMQDLYGSMPSLQNQKSVVAKVTDVLEISDSDSDESVIEVQKSIGQGPINDEILVIE